MRTLNTDPTLLRYLVRILCICTTIVYPVMYIFFAYSIHTLHIDSVCTRAMDTLYTYPISRLYMHTLYENLYALHTLSTATLCKICIQCRLYTAHANAMRNLQARQLYANPRRYGTGHRKKLLAHSPLESCAVRALASSARGS